MIFWTINTDKQIINILYLIPGFYNVVCYYWIQLVWDGKYKLYGKYC